MYIKVKQKKSDITSVYGSLQMSGKYAWINRHVSLVQNIVTKQLKQKLYQWHIYKSSQTHIG